MEYQIVIKPWKWHDIKYAKYSFTISTRYHHSWILWDMLQYILGLFQYNLHPVICMLEDWTFRKRLYQPLEIGCQLSFQIYFAIRLCVKIGNMGRFTLAIMLVFALTNPSLSYSKSGNPGRLFKIWIMYLFVYINMEYKSNNMQCLNNSISI